MSGPDPFDTRRLRESVLAAWSGSPTRFREDANAEEDLYLGAYRDRLLVELAQNAADAALAAGEPGTLRLSVVDGEVRAANTGAPLDAAGVAALASLRASAKRTGHGIGRFGVGFAAVLAVSDEPRVVSRHGGVAFSAARTRSAIEANEELSARARERAGRVPVLRLAWPVHPGADGEDALPAGFDTEVRLPLRVGIDADALLTAFAEQVEDLLLSLRGLRRIEIGDATWHREDVAGSVVALHGPAGTTRWLVVRDAGELSAEVTASLGVESQERPQWTVCWAVRVRPDGTPDPLAEDVLHAPTPTDERLSVPARLIATLPIEPSRRRLLPGPAADAVLGEAARRYPRLITSLAPLHRTSLVPVPDFPLSEVDDRLRELVLATLRSARWLPAAGPREAMLAPAGARVLDAPSDALAGLLADVVPGLLDAELAAGRHARALAALDVARMPAAELVAAVTGIDRRPPWWHGLYDALLPVVEADSALREELGGLPVPLVDGRTLPGPRGALLMDADAELLDDLSHVDITALRIVHPDAAHPLLERLGARRGGPDDLLDSAALREAVERSVDDAESGVDISGLVDLVLRLVRDAGGRPWLGALALQDGAGDWRRADELALPGSAFLEVLAEDSPLGVLAERVAKAWPARVLTAVGVLESFVVVADDEPTAPDHDLADEAQWWDSLPEPPTRLTGIRDLDLVAEDAWPAALRLLAADPELRRAIYQPDGYTGWWIGRHALLAGAPPRSWRLPVAASLAGLFDQAPDLGIEDAVLAAVGVRTALAVTSAADAENVLARLGDPARAIPSGVALRAHAAMALAVRDDVIDAADVEPPARVRTIAGDAAPVGDLLVLDAPWLLGIVAPDRLVSAGVDFALAEPLAELLDLPLAGEEIGAFVDPPGEPVAWSELGAVVIACDLAGIEVPGGGTILHDKLIVRAGDATHPVSWWVDRDGWTHAEDTPEALARALAWSTNHWRYRHTLAALIADPETPTHLG